MSEENLNFSEGFSGGDKEAWLALVEKTLRGKPFEKAMRRETYDGIGINALNCQPSEPYVPQPTRAAGDWAVVSPNWSSDPESVNADILEDLERGASAIAITLDGHLSSNNLDKALNGIYLDMVPFILIQGSDFASAADSMLQILKTRDHSADDLKGTLGIDPIGALARAGRTQMGTEDALESAAEYAIDCSEHFPGVAAFVADGTVYANAGAPSSVEVAAALSAAVHYLRVMEAKGLSLENAAKNIQFTLSADADLWVTIAKYRAIRQLWDGILSACGVDGVSAHINAVSAVYMSTQRDPWVNILRGTAACFSAGVGGANTITTLPHDLMLGTSNKFSRRIARNIQIMLLEESNLAKVTDPAAGSYALERLTLDLTKTAEMKFKLLEEQGGVLAALRVGTLQAEIKEASTKRAEDIRKRKRPLTGVSEFPNIDEPFLPTPLDGQSSNAEKEVNYAERIEAVPLRSLAFDYEVLRAKSDAITEKLGSRPSIYLANIGTAADFTARATFAKNFFEAGGLIAQSGNGSLATQELITEYKTSGAKLAILCGTDALYAEHAQDLVVGLKATGCERIYVAGKLTNSESLKQVGLDEMIFMGGDVIDALERALDVYSQDNGDAS